MSRSNSLPKTDFWWCPLDDPFFLAVLLATDRCAEDCCGCPLDESGGRLLLVFVVVVGLVTAAGRSEGVATRESPGVATVEETTWSELWFLVEDAAEEDIEAVIAVVGPGGPGTVRPAPTGSRDEDEVAVETCSLAEVRFKSSVARRSLGSFESSWAARSFKCLASDPTPWAAWWTVPWSRSCNSRFINARCMTSAWSAGLWSSSCPCGVGGIDTVEYGENCGVDTFEASSE